MAPAIVHSNISKHLFNAETALIAESDLILISYYVNGRQRTNSDRLAYATQKRLLDPHKPLVFLSFLPLSYLKSNDKFGILSLQGTSFVRLPCNKRYLKNLIIKLKSNVLRISSSQWNSFAENACKLLLKELVAELKHGKKFEIGNQALHPLRAAATLMMHDPNNSSFKQAFASRLNAFNDYINTPEIREMLVWAKTCNNPSDPFLKQVGNLVIQLNRISEYGKRHDEVKQLIYDINKANKLKNSIFT